MHQIQPHLKSNKLHIIVLVLISALLSSCSIRKFVPEGKYLVKSNKVVIEEKGTEISKSGVSKYISLKPYKKSIQTNLPTWIYYQFERRPKSKFWSWMNRNFGREPIYYDKAEADNSSIQMMRYIDNVGYFHSKVDHTIQLKERRKLARVTYHVYPAKPYHINSIEYDIGDTLMESFIMRDSAKFNVDVGDIYNAYTLGDQRDMITERLRNSGYYYFNHSHIQYEVDSNYMNHSLSVKMKVAPNEVAHRRYRINNISIYPNFSIFRMNEKPTDSASLTVKVGRRQMPNTLDFYYFGKPRVKPSTFGHSIQIVEGFPYMLRSVTSTYEALANFSLFGNVNIQFDSVPNDKRNLLDCRITMQQNDAHSFTVQAEGTHSDGDLGIKGSVSYSNRNIFHGAEVLRLSLKGGLEAQKIIDITDPEDENKRQVFNTREYGFSASLLFPKFLAPFTLTTFSRDYQPTTSVSLGLNAQIRYYYSRYISSASFTYDWKSSYRVKHSFSPIYLNSVKIDNINPEFQEFLDHETNQRKKNQYTSHLIFGLRYSFIFNTQRINQQGSFVYLRADLESSGNLLSLFNKTKLITEDHGIHKIWGVPYAQYVRTSFDIRQHIDLGHNNWLVFRQFIGLGIPYGNSDDLPFERSFYAGGANSLRGWVYRGVGPGGYVPSGTDIEKIGDIHLELNAEYRFPIYDIFNGAVFFDAGNVWAYHPNLAMPNSEFRFNSFYKQLAMDAGLGLRIDVSFLILRVDFAYAMRNPFPDENGRYWRFGNDLFTDNWRMNIGIGYPF